MTTKRLLSGNEAIALGAYEAGVAYASSYPGTPATEILEAVARYPGVVAEWAPNEKVALDAAAGAAYAGVRAMASMKHVGVNVAAESLFYLAYTGVNAGLVLVSADDPGAFSSQNEQDNRQYARFAKVPCLEPSDSQEAKDFTRLGFEISEQFDTPVMLRSTTRISHSKSVVEVGTEAEQPVRGAPRPFLRNPQKYVMIPAFARRRHPIVEERVHKLAEYAETTPINRIEWSDRSIGVITSSIAYQYAREVFAGASILKLGMSYPLPTKMICQFASQVGRVVVLEELDPFFEEQIRALGIDVVGKDVFPLVGEFTVSIVRERAIAAGLVPPAKVPPVPADTKLQIADLPARPPALCPGCPHRSTFYLLRKLKLRVAGDIGCYTIGVLPPFDSIDTTGCMGASIGVAHGIDKAGATEKFVAVLGDSTLFHAGLPPLVNAVYNRGATTMLILDNATTGMTGQQDNPGTGKTLQGETAPVIDIERLVWAMGVEDVWVADAFDIVELEKIVKQAIAVRDRPSVVVVRGKCVFVDRRPRSADGVDFERCNGCSLCFRLGCPAISKGEVDARTGKPKAVIDELLCVGCDMCLDLCPREAIYSRG